MNLSLASDCSLTKKLKQEDFMNKLLDKDSLMLYSSSVNTFPSSDTDSFEGTSSLTSQNTEDKASVDNSCFNYPFDEITHSNNNLNFLEINEDNEFSDCLYSKWPEIENFEDVDMMFRSSDSTFGIGESNDYGPCCVSNDRFTDKEQVNDHKEHFKLQGKSHENLFMVPTDELSMPGKRPSLSGNFGDVARVGKVSPAELGSYNVQEITTKGSGSGDIFGGASIFCQLQLVMKQLDSRTKICMKDNLYRLARSAEQRHKHVNLNGDCGDRTDPNGTRMAKRKKGCTSFMDVETDTNSIDRSIADLLFYMPSTSAVGAA